jgi:hypothetical protein
MKNKFSSTLKLKGEWEANLTVFLQTLLGRKTVLIDDCSLGKSFTQKVVLCVLKVFLLLFSMQRNSVQGQIVAHKLSQSALISFVVPEERKLR